MKHWKTVAVKLIFERLLKQENEGQNIIGGASTASEATLSSSPLRLPVYVGIIIIVRATNP